MSRRVNNRLQHSYVLVQCQVRSQVCSCKMTWWRRVLDTTLPRATSCRVITVAATAGLIVHRKSRRISGRRDSGYSLAPPTSSPTSDTRSLRVYYGMYCLRTRPPYSKVLPSHSLSNLLQYCSHRQNISLYCMFYHLQQSRGCSGIVCKCLT